MTDDRPGIHLGTGTLVALQTFVIAKYLVAFLTTANLVIGMPRLVVASQIVLLVEI